MTDDEVSDLLCEVAVRLAKPVLNGEVQQPAPKVQGDDQLFTILWDYGYLPARDQVLAQGATEAQIAKAQADFKTLGNIVEPSDLIRFPTDLAQKLHDTFIRELPSEPRISRFRLDERIVREITDFKVEMFTDEGLHRGRPHVKVHLKGGAVSISLDDPPVNLTQRGGLVGESTALKTIATHRKQLLELWKKTRPDTQKLEPKEKQKATAKRLRSNKKSKQEKI